jgi:MarR family transcriptional regulator for hemolysin
MLTIKQEEVKKMSRLDPYDSLGFHCSLTMKAFKSALEVKLKGTGVSAAQFVALAHLTALGPLAQSELADRLSITPATAVRLIDRMVRDGWVVRQTDPHDGRSKQIILTERAAEIWGKVSQAGRDLLSQAYQGIDPEEIEIVMKILAQARHNLEG